MRIVIAVALVVLVVPGAGLALAQTAQEWIDPTVRAGAGRVGAGERELQGT